jgi:hypothetical protein
MCIKTEDSVELSLAMVVVLLLKNVAACTEADCIVV